MNRKIVIALAHPDDESYGPGGTIAKYSSKGVEVRLITATNGENARFRSPHKITSDLGSVRKEEIHQAGRILGIRQISFLNYPDGMLNTIPIEHLKAKIRKILLELKPQIVITFDLHGITGHPDHQLISKATTEVFFELKNGTQTVSDENERQFSKLYYYTIPDSWFNSLPWKIRFILKLRRKFRHKGTADEEITTAIDTSSFSAIKKKACAAHKSQWNNFNRIKQNTGENYFLKEFFVLVNSGDFDLSDNRREKDLFDGLIGEVYNNISKSTGGRVNQ
jgi:LmbE family N-acetylglucosaminyl deacetylase